MRAANGTGIGLGVEPAVKWIIVFGLALRTHREGFHRRVGAVVGNGFDDAEAGAAMGAIREGIAESAVRRVVDFAEALRAGGDIGKDEGGFGAGFLTRSNFEIFEPRCSEPRGFDVLNETQGRFFNF